jgi:ankyrin repeat protein
VEYLLEVGASPCSAFTRRKLTAVMACARAGNERMMEKLLVAAPQAVNVQTRDGDTALHKALEEQRIKAAGLLLRAGADPHLQNEDGVSAMGIARFRCPEEYKEMVARYGECKDDLELAAPSAAVEGAAVGAAEEEIDKYNK